VSEKSRECIPCAYEHTIVPNSANGCLLIFLKRIDEKQNY